VHPGTRLYGYIITVDAATPLQGIDQPEALVVVTGFAVTETPHNPGRFPVTPNLQRRDRRGAAGQSFRV
jgi:hypothetical protein